jgi:hypothetical protein
MRADEEAIRQLTLPWVLRGLEELRGARRMLADRPDFEAWMVTFHIEQAVEKLLRRLSYTSRFARHARMTSAISGS